MKALLLLTGCAALALSGCMNMPTDTAQITGSYVSPLRYSNSTCKDLLDEQAAMAQRENRLVSAQNQRIKSSQMQAFWWGFGQGDGIEAAEIASIRGEREAISAAISKKSCGVEQVAAPAPIAAPVQTPTAP